MCSKWSRVLAVWFVGFGLACQGPQASPVKAEVAVETQANVKGASKSCEEKTFCTSEYQPTICKFEGKSYAASNPCEARKLVRRFACEKAVPFLDAKVQCEANADERPTVSNCQPVTVCTREMIPHLCTYNGEQFTGPNRCETMAKVKTFACERGLKFNENTVACVATNEKEGTR